MIAKRLLTGIIVMLTIHSAQGYDHGMAGFSIEVQGETNPYEIFSTFVMPGKEVHIKGASTLKIWSSDLVVEQYDAGSKVIAPSTPGAWKVFVEDMSQQRMTINILVLTPLSGLSKESLNGYRIGQYPTEPLRGNPIYNQPPGLFEVTKENESLQLVPHFTLKQFLCKQAGDHPKYVIVNERLLLKLEYLLAKVNEQGMESNTFGFISGYRTPFYNASIKNVRYSRHIYGGAADIMIDNDRDGSMDDLNNDGLVDQDDVWQLYRIVENEFNKPGYQRFRGGLGFYKGNGRHNGFIHVDVRGTRARW